MVSTLEGDQLPVHWPADTLSRSSAFGGRCTHRTRAHAGVVQRVGVRGTWLVWWQVVARDRRLPRDETVPGEGCCRCRTLPGNLEPGCPQPAAQSRGGVGRGRAVMCRITGVTEVREGCSSPLQPPLSVVLPLDSLGDRSYVKPAQGLVGLPCWQTSFRGDRPLGG